MCILCILVYFGCKKRSAYARALERTHIILFTLMRAKEWTINIFSLSRRGRGKREEGWCMMYDVRGMMDDVRGKRRCFFKTYARGMQGGLINIWRFSRVCNVFTLAKVKSQRAIALGKFHSIDIVGATTGTWNTGESTEGVAAGPSRAQPSYIDLAFHWRYRLIKVLGSDRSPHENKFSRGPYFCSSESADGSRRSRWAWLESWEMLGETGKFWSTVLFGGIIRSIILGSERRKLINAYIPKPIPFVWHNTL